MMWSYGSFNEAPALRGGNLWKSSKEQPETDRFNEAPALRGGNQGRSCGAKIAPHRFNEAPALRGGNRPAGRLANQFGAKLQ